MRCLSSMVICSEIRMGRHRTVYHRENTPLECSLKGFFALINLIWPWPIWTILSPLAVTRRQSRFFHRPIRNQEIKVYQIRHDSWIFEKISKNLAGTLQTPYGMRDFGGQTDKPKSRVDSVEPGSSSGGFFLDLLYLNFPFL